ncbi:MAG: alpha/beta hydrolase [Alphaproteobacteria bacterium]|nr:alpha/beta hydrolase [Alphaproteobacteria bacterium]
MADSFSTEAGSVTMRAGKLTFLAAGAADAPALVLLHGIGSTAASFSAQLQTLSAGFRVIAWNAPGYDGSSHLAADWPDVSDYAARLEEFLDGLGVSKAHIVGHSLGSLIAGCFARQYPQRVLSLQLASCALGHARLDGPRRETLLQSRIGDVEELGLAGMAAKRGPNLLTPAATPVMRANVIAAMASLDPRGYGQAARMLSKGDLLSDIAVLAPSLPLHVLYGAQDRITPPQANLEAAAARALITVTEIPDAGHAVYIEQAAAFSKAIARFAQGQDI